MRDIPGTESAALLRFALVSELIEVPKAKNVLTAGDIYDLHNRLARDLGQLPQDIS